MLTRIRGCCKDKNPQVSETCVQVLMHYAIDCIESHFVLWWFRLKVPHKLMIISQRVYLTWHWIESVFRVTLTYGSRLIPFLCQRVPSIWLSLLRWQGWENEIDDKKFWFDVKSHLDPFFSPFSSGPINVCFFFLDSLLVGVGHNNHGLLKKRPFRVTLLIITSNLSFHVMELSSHFTLNVHKNTPLCLVGTFLYRHQWIGSKLDRVKIRKKFHRLGVATCWHYQMFLCSLKTKKKME